MRVIKALAILGLLFVVAAVVALPFLPKEVTVQRSLDIHATPEALYADISNLKTWPEWSSWSAQNDPTFQPRFEGASAGAGAKEVWEQSSSGSGSLTITDADPAHGIHYRVVVNGGRFLVDGDVLLQRNADATRVTWRDHLDLRNNLFARYMAPLLDTMLGKPINISLGKLKARAEKTAAPATAAGADAGTR